MSVRDVSLEDIPALKQIHEEMGFDYKMPDLSSPLVLTKKAITDASGKIIGACYTLLQAETYLLLDPELSPSEKVAAITEVDREVAGESYEKGLNSLVCYLPPGVEEKFQKRLLACGWLPARKDWVTWFKDLTGLGAIDG
jgi:hypothetical protein